ncbi:Peroxidase [Rhynchospora pubera]|uniref:Peroxidase n=1 Tax=Rhynchospora pubera TaxID=906938 RepID=A0AAV8AUF3_9POAL|nr:Peroxidase [Rhynchospora pubera]
MDRITKKILCLLLIALFFDFPVEIDAAGLRVGFYTKTCPSAESLVQQAVAAAFANNSGMAAGLIRMHFHDCFVRGCDGSVLLDSPNKTAEKDSIPNNPSLRGFEVIDSAKSAIEAKCPKTVSCADILAFAARDSVALTGNIIYAVPAGRRDGTVSNATEALLNLPALTFDAAQLINSFKGKNLTEEDLVTLSGAHTLGVSHCTNFLNRIYNFSNTVSVDPSLSKPYASLLQNLCPPNVTRFTPTVTALDLISPTVLDNKYYVLLKQSLGLLTTDNALLTDANLSAIVTDYANHQKTWEGKFAKAMVKMGKIEVLTGNQGQIRVNCRVVNKGTDTEQGLVSGSGPDQFTGVASS